MAQLFKTQGLTVFLGGPKGYSFYLHDKECTNDEDTTLLRHSVETLHCPGPLVPDAVVKQFLMTMGMIEFQNSRSRATDLNHQRQGELNYCKVWQGWNGSWTGQLTGMSHR